MHTNRENSSDLFPATLRTRVLERLMLPSSVNLDYDGLRKVYAAWCAHVPFDNSRKLVALFSNDTRPLPGGTAVDFFEHWLSLGSGGTCWPSSNALFTLVQSFGFAARRVAGSMRDNGIHNHGSVKVSIAGKDWLVDSSILRNVPLPIGEPLFIGTDSVFAVEVEYVDGQHIIWFDTSPIREYFPCRLLLDPVTHDFYLDRYEASRERSAFNQYIYARRNKPGTMIVVRGAKLNVTTETGVVQTELSRDQLCEVLRDEIELSGTLIDQWKSSGAMEASFQPPVTPPPPPLVGIPPSRRER